MMKFRTTKDGLEHHNGKNLVFVPFNKQPKYDANGKRWFAVRLESGEEIQAFEDEIEGLSETDSNELKTYKVVVQFSSMILEVEAANEEQAEDMALEELKDPSIYHDMDKEINSITEIQEG